MVRNRLEDLGRLAMLLDNFLKHWFFEYMEETYQGRNKDFVEWYEEQSEDLKEEILRKMIYGIENIKEKIYEMNEIAEGMDRLNRKDGDYGE